MSNRPAHSVRDHIRSLFDCLKTIEEEGQAISTELERMSHKALTQSILPTLLGENDRLQAQLLAAIDRLRNLDNIPTADDSPYLAQIGKELGTTRMTCCAFLDPDNAHLRHTLDRARCIITRTQGLDIQMDWGQNTLSRRS